MASRDRYYPRDGWEGNEVDFDWDVQCENRCDQLISRFHEVNNGTSIIIKAAFADNIGGFKLELCKGYCIEVFPDDTISREYWRLFKPYIDFETLCHNLSWYL